MGFPPTSGLPICSEETSDATLPFQGAKDVRAMSRRERIRLLEREEALLSQATQPTHPTQQLGTVGQSTGEMGEEVFEDSGSALGISCDYHVVYFLRLIVEMRLDC